MSVYQKVLLAADGSDHARRASGHAVKLLKNVPDGHLDVIYIIDKDQSKSDVLHYGNKEIIQMKRREQLEDLESDLKEAGISYEVHIEHGEPGPTIVSFANSGAYDCLVIGSRGLNQLQTMVLGSVSHKVVKRVQCPVLVVK